MFPTLLATHIAKARFLLGQNSSTILTGMGVAGTVSTAVLTARGTFKAANAISTEEINKSNVAWKPEGTEEVLVQRVPLSKVEQVKLVWPFYIPAVTTGMITVIAIVAANRIDSKKIAALTVASGLSDRALQEYKAKVEEKLTARQMQNVKDELASDRVHAKPTPSESVLMVGEGQVLCFDELTGRYFRSSAEDIKKAENKLNHRILNNDGASLAEFHDELGIESTPYTDMVGWSPDTMVEVEFHSVLKDNKPVLAVNFNYPPIAAYTKLH
jgi:hypothetical protein